MATSACTLYLLLLHHEHSISPIRAGVSPNYLAYKKKDVACRAGGMILSGVHVFLCTKSVVSTVLGHVIFMLDGRTFGEYSKLILMTQYAIMYLCSMYV